MTQDIAITADLRELRSHTDPGWILRTGRMIAQRADRPGGYPQTPLMTDLLHAAQDQADACRGLSPEAVRREIDGIIMAPGVHAGLQWLYDSGVLSVWLPELAATVNFSQEAGRRHKDVWEHTKQVVYQAELRPTVRWAALLHDIGKVPTRTFTSDGKVHFHRHSEVGARMFEDVGRRLGLEREMHRTLRFLILHHLRANQYVETWTDSAVRRFDREMDGHLVDLLDLSRADITSRRPGKRQQALLSIDALARRVQELREEDAVQPPLPSGIGDAIMERFHLKPSRLIGDLKRALEKSIEGGELEARREPAYYMPQVEKLLSEAAQAPCPCTE
jgi:poly(A) polymerase